jgi:CheY-like chemotaxis protein
MTTNVLILDDNKDNLTLLYFCFRTLKSGYEIFEAMNGADVRSVADQTTHLDLALLDIELPDADGLDLAEYLRQKFPDLVVMMLSSNDELEKLEKARHLRLNAYVVKPFNLSVILGFLREFESHQINVDTQMQVF